MSYKMKLQLIRQCLALDEDLIVKDEWLAWCEKYNHKPITATQQCYDLWLNRNELQHDDIHHMKQLFKKQKDGIIITVWLYLRTLQVFEVGHILGQNRKGYFWCHFMLIFYSCGTCWLTNKQWSWIGEMCLSHLNTWNYTIQGGKCCI